MIAYFYLYKQLENTIPNPSIQFIMSRVFKSFDTEIAENLTSSEPKERDPKQQSQSRSQPSSQDPEQQDQKPKPQQTQSRKTAIKKQTFDELYGEPENFLEIEVSMISFLLLFTYTNIYIGSESKNSWIWKRNVYRL